MLNDGKDAGGREASTMTVEQQLGRLIVISGPSGAGKTSICKGLLERLPNARWSVSATTRPIRKGDVDGESYEFINDAEFERRREAGEFLEFANYCGHWYGTPKQPINEATQAGCDVILEIDVQGATQVAAAMSSSIRIFVLPPNMESLRARLEGRKSEAEAALKARLKEADGEIAYARDSGVYQYFLVNDMLEETIKEAERIIRKERSNV